MRGFTTLNPTEFVLPYKAEPAGLLFLPEELIRTPNSQASLRGQPTWVFCAQATTG